MKPLAYVIQVNTGTQMFFLKTDLQMPSIEFMPLRTQATRIPEKVVAQGWLMQAQVLYPNYRFSLVQV